MKKLEDLKKELLDNKVNKFYVFYGEDFGIRKHYINKISTYFTSKPKYINDFNSIKISGKTKSLFGDTKSLVVVYNDENFAKQPSKEIQKFIDNSRDYTCIFEYEEPIENSALFKEFDSYITYFPVVQDNIAQEFVKSELKLLEDDTKSLAYNCENNYNNILLESNKIKTYANAKQISEQNSYEILNLKNQLLEKIDKFNVSEFMIDILLQQNQNFAYWYQVIKNDTDKFFGSLIAIFNDFLIAALIKKYGAFDKNVKDKDGKSIKEKGGSSIAYEYGLPWSRIKDIRVFEKQIPYGYEYLLECAYKVACIDTNIKIGQIEKDKVIDYFFSDIV